MNGNSDDNDDGSDHDKETVIHPVHNTWALNQHHHHGCGNRYRNGDDDGTNFEAIINVEIVQMVLVILGKGR